MNDVESPRLEEGIVYGSNERCLLHARGQQGIDFKLFVLNHLVSRETLAQAVHGEGI
jgi:hypothetical protein